MRNDRIHISVDRMLKSKNQNILANYEIAGENLRFSKSSAKGGGIDQLFSDWMRSPDFSFIQPKDMFIKILQRRCAELPYFKYLAKLPLMKFQEKILKDPRLLESIEKAFPLALGEFFGRNDYNALAKYYRQDLLYFFQRASLGGLPHGLFSKTTDYYEIKKTDYGLSLELRTEFSVRLIGYQDSAYNDEKYKPDLLQQEESFYQIRIPGDAAITLKMREGGFHIIEGVTVSDRGIRNLLLSNHSFPMFQTILQRWEKQCDDKDRLKANVIRLAYLEATRLIDYSSENQQARRSDQQDEIYFLLRSAQQVLDGYINMKNPTSDDATVCFEWLRQLASRVSKYQPDPSTRQFFEKMAAFSNPQQSAKINLTPFAVKLTQESSLALQLVPSLVAIRNQHYPAGRFRDWLRRLPVVGRYFARRFNGSRLDYMKTALPSVEQALQFTIAKMEKLLSGVKYDADSLGKINQSLQVMRQLSDFVDHNPYLKWPSAELKLRYKNLQVIAKTLQHLKENTQPVSLDQMLQFAKLRDSVLVDLAGVVNRLNEQKKTSLAASPHSSLDSGSVSDAAQSRPRKTAAPDPADDHTEDRDTPEPPSPK